MITTLFLEFGLDLVSLNLNFCSFVENSEEQLILTIDAEKRLSIYILKKFPF